MSETNERSVASTGSVEPAAWGVLRVGGGWVSILANEVQAETSRKSWDARENWVHEVAPLYLAPVLTDAEREALEVVLRMCGDPSPVTAPLVFKYAATLRGLLDRACGADGKKGR